MIGLRILSGVILLLMGRRLFWLFVGMVGFVYGIDFARHFFSTQPPGVILVIALAIGFLGVVLSLLLQRLAILLAGFFAGGYIASSLLNQWGMSILELPQWSIFIIGGIIGLILAGILFNWALIILSSFMGAILIVEAAPFNPIIKLLLFIVLLILGMAIQVGTLGPKPSTTKS